MPHSARLPVPLLLKPSCELLPLRRRVVCVAQAEAGPHPGAMSLQERGPELAVDQVPGGQPHFLPERGGPWRPADRLLGRAGVLGQRGQRPDGVGIAAVEVGVQGCRQVRQHDGAGRRWQREQVGVEVRGGGHALRVPVSRWLTSSRSASGDPGQALHPRPVAEPLPEVFQAVVGVAPVRCPGGGRQDGTQAGQRLVQVGEAGVVAGMDPCVRAGQARQERGAAAAVRRRLGAVVGSWSSPRSLSRRPRGRAGPGAGRSGLPCGHGRRRPRRRPRSPRRPPAWTRLSGRT